MLTLGVVFAVPSGHNATAYLVVLNSFTVSRRWLRRSCPHDGGELFRDALGDFICEICGRACDDEGADPGRDV